MNLDHILTLYYFEVGFNIIITFVNVSHIFMFYDYNFCIPVFLMRATFPANLIVLDLITRLVICEQCKS